MYVTFTYQLLIGFNSDKSQVWKEIQKTFHVTNEENEMHEYKEDIKQHEKLGNIKYISECVHD